MTDDHVRLKVKEALTSTGGNRHDAQKLLITWAVRDHALLLGIVKPHLKAIAAGLVEHALRSKGGDGSDAGPDHISRSTIEDVLSTATVGRPSDKRKHRNIPPPKSTERQATTMRRIAAAFTRKKK